jgi:membrane-associated protease RseP (regulator of RpoE activity)
MIGGISGILAIIFFVTAHEAGHFVAAKATGMKATEFFFGFGPRLLAWRRGETEYGIKLLPLGGYVKIIGMNPLEEVDPADFGRTYREKPFWKKSVVVLAGVGTNFLIALVIFIGLFVVRGVEEVSSMVDVVVDEDGGAPTPAALAGIRPGDVIVAVNGEPTPGWLEIANTLAAHPGDEVALTIVRDGATLELTAVLAERFEASTGETRGFLGIAPSIVARSVGPAEAIGLAGRQVGITVGLTFEILGRIVRPDSLARLAGTFVGQTDIPPEIRPVSPIGVGQIGAQVDEIGVASFVYLLAAISVILATINVLPLYPLDGGHFAVALYEKVTGRQADPRKLAPIAVAVILLVGFLGLVGIVLDIVNPIDL